MRIITQVTPGHNATADCFTSVKAGLLILLMVVMAGCFQDAEKKSPPVVDTHPRSVPCNLTTDTSGWAEFKELTDHITATGEVPREDLEAFGSLPAVTLWRHSFSPDVPDAWRVANWLEGTFWEELGHQGRQKMNADRADFMRSYRYSIDHRERIDERLVELTGPRIFEILAKTDYWIEPGRLPDTLAIYFLPAKPEIRIFEGALLVDTGVVSAGNTDQVIRQMAGLLYRKYQYLEGPSPADLDGGEAIAHIFRVLMNEGVASWIDQTAITEFDLEHPTLSKFQVVPEFFFIKTREAVKLINHKLATMLGNEEAMAASDQGLIMTLGVMNAYSQTGYGMATVIAARLGEDRLRDCGRSVPAFVSAYQEAALLNSLPLPEPGTKDVELYETVPPLDPEVYANLLPLLLKYFPE